MGDTVEDVEVFMVIQMLVMQIMSACGMFVFVMHAVAMDAIDGNEGGRNRKRRRGSNQNGEFDLLLQGITEIAKAFNNHFEHVINNLELIGSRIGHARDLSEARSNVNGELMKLPLNRDQRLKAGLLIVEDDWKVDFFLSLPQGDKLEWVSMLLNGDI